MGRAASRMGLNQANKALMMLDEMDVVSIVHNIFASTSLLRQSIKELENAIQAWQQMDPKKYIPSASKLKSEKEKERAKDAPKEGMFGIFKKSMYAYSFPRNLILYQPTYQRSQLRKHHRSSERPHG